VTTNESYAKEFFEEKLWLYLEGFAGIETTAATQLGLQSKSIDTGRQLGVSSTPASSLAHLQFSTYERAYALDGLLDNEKLWDNLSLFAHGYLELGDLAGKPLGPIQILGFDATVSYNPSDDSLTLELSDHWGKVELIFLGITDPDDRSMEVEEEFTGSDSFSFTSQIELLNANGPTAECTFTSRAIPSLSFQLPFEGSNTPPGEGNNIAFTLDDIDIGSTHFLSGPPLEGRITLEVGTSEPSSPEMSEVLQHCTDYWDELKGSQIEDEVPFLAFFYGISITLLDSIEKGDISAKDLYFMFSSQDNDGMDRGLTLTLTNDDIAIETLRWLREHGTEVILLLQNYPDLFPWLSAMILGRGMGSKLEEGSSLDMSMTTEIEVPRSVSGIPGGPLTGETIIDINIRYTLSFSQSGATGKIVSWELF